MNDEGLPIFISWSGDLGRAVAEIFRDWLPLVIPDAKPWMSKDTSKGYEWWNEIRQRLKSCKAAITVITRENLSSPWVHFEVGAILLAANDRVCCTVLVDLGPSDIKGPLERLQHTLVEKKDMRQLVETLNKQSPSPKPASQVDEWFDMSWDRKFLSKYEEACTASTTVSTGPKPERGDRDLLEELVVSTREIRRQLAESVPPAEAGEIYAVIRERAKELGIRLTVDRGIIRLDREVFESPHRAMYRLRRMERDRKEQKEAWAQEKRELALAEKYRQKGEGLYTQCEVLHLEKDDDDGYRSSIGLGSPSQALEYLKARAEGRELPETF